MKIVIYYGIGIFIFLFTYIFKKESISDFLTFIGTFSIFFIVPVIELIQVDKISTIKDIRNLFKSSILYRNKDIRVSISYLFKIKIDDKYFLIKGKRINQYQPVGGVYKYYSEAKSIFARLGVKDDDCIPIDSSSKDDLRIRVKGKNLGKLIKWFESGKERGVCVQREFYEELIKDKILDAKNFNYIDCIYLNRIIDDIKYDNHFNCQQILIADIYELKLNNEQLKEFKKLMDVKSDKYIWSYEDQINALGYEKYKKETINIPPTAKWLIGN